MNNQSLFQRITRRLRRDSNDSTRANFSIEAGSLPSMGTLEGSSYRARLLRLAGQLWAWLFLTLLIAYFSFTPGFFDLRNFQAVLANNAILLVLALGQTFVIITAGIDLSTGFVMGLASVAASLAMRSLPGDLNLALVIGAGFVTSIVIGLISGLINGTVISRLKVPPFIATLGMYGIARGVAYILSGGPPVSVSNPGIGQFGNGYVLYYHPNSGISFLNLPAGITGLELRHVTSILPLLVVYFVVLLVIMHWVLSKTKFGQHVYAVGGSSMAALRAGIPVNRILVTVYVISGVMAGIAGFLYVMRYTGGVAAAGDALMLSSIAAIVIGGASLLGGEGTMIGTFVGSLIIAVIQNGLIIVGIDPFWQYVAVGVIIILAVLIDQVKAQVLT